MKKNSQIPLTKNINISHERNNVPEPFSYVGPLLHLGEAMPAIVYFAVTAESSLTQEPFNQPIIHLSKFPLRVFSFTLPHHSSPLNFKRAMTDWANDFIQEIDPLNPFLDNVVSTLQYLMEQKVITKIGVMGLSRGAFIAMHVAARLRAISHILGFAPLINLTSLREFAGISSLVLVQKYDPYDLISILYDRSIRFYMSNYDQRVGTKNAFTWINDLAHHAHEKGIRSAPIELYIRPPIGYLGHGTSLDTFNQGADWLAKELL